MEELIDLQTVAKPSSEIEIAANVTSLELLQQVYRNPSLPLSTRMRAAATALPFEFPKLAVTASFNGEAFADRLEKAFSRSAKVIEAEPILALPEPTRPKTMVPDRRFRRA